MVRYPPLVLSFRQAHLCDTPCCYISRENCAICSIKTSTKTFCDTIATSIARYEKYRCWASKAESNLSAFFFSLLLHLGPKINSSLPGHLIWKSTDYGYSLEWLKRMSLDFSRSLPAPRLETFIACTQRTAKGASGKGPRQKIVKKSQKYFRHFLTFFAQGKKHQKSSKSVKNIFDTS